MEKRDYQKELDHILAANTGKKPSLLLLSCCGPCSAYVLEYLTRHFSVTLLWFNPNLYPEAEYDRRLSAQQELIDKMGLRDSVPVLVQPWRSGEYYAAIRGLEQEPEGGSRCSACFRLRLEETARLCREGSYDYFCTTLTLSRHKNAILINSIAEELASQYGVNWLPSEFKKRGGELRSAQLVKEHGIYRQEYCGCEFSKAAVEAKNAARAAAGDKELP